MKVWDYVFPAVLLVVSGAVCVGWAVDYRPLLSVIPGAVTMKFATASMFFLWGVAVMCAQLNRGVVLGMSASFAVLLISLLSAAGSNGDLPFASDDYTAETVEGGEPSLGTMVAFFLLGLAGALKGALPTFKAAWPGALVAAIGLVGVLGYIVDNPVMRFYVPGLSTGMAIHTAILFVLCGERLARYRLRIHELK